MHSTQPTPVEPAPPKLQQCQADRTVASHPPMSACLPTPFWCTLRGAFQACAALRSAEATTTHLPAVVAASCAVVTTSVWGAACRLPPVICRSRMNLSWPSPLFQMRGLLRSATPCRAGTSTCCCQRRETKPNLYPQDNEDNPTLGSCPPMPQHQLLCSTEPKVITPSDANSIMTALTIL